MLCIVAYQRFSNDSTREAFVIVWGMRIATQIKKLCAFIFVTIGLSVCYLQFFWMIKEKNSLKWLKLFKFASIIPVVWKYNIQALSFIGAWFHSAVSILAVIDFWFNFLQGRFISLLACYASGSKTAVSLYCRICQSPLKVNRMTSAL